MQYERCSFDIDIERCPHCGGTLTIIAAIEEHAVIAKILSISGYPPARLRAARHAHTIHPIPINPNFFRSISVRL